MKSFFTKITKSAIILISAFAIASCSEEDTAPKVTTDVIAADEIRLSVDIKAAGIAATDVYHLAGSFTAPNTWVENGPYTLTKTEDGKFYIDLKASMIDGGKELQFKLQRNGKWTYVEKSATCAEIDNRVLTVAGNLGKEVKITVDAFRNTGSCPD